MLRVERGAPRDRAEAVAPQPQLRLLHCRQHGGACAIGLQVEALPQLARPVALASSESISKLRTAKALMMVLTGE